VSRHDLDRQAAAMKADGASSLRHSGLLRALVVVCALLCAPCGALAAPAPDAPPTGVTLGRLVPDAPEGPSPAPAITQPHAPTPPPAAPAPRTTPATYRAPAPAVRPAAARHGGQEPRPRRSAVEPRRARHVPIPLLADLLRHDFPPVRVVARTGDALDHGLLALAGVTLALVALCGGVVATGAGLSLRRA